MKLTHIFYKELIADKENIFTANISQNNEVEIVKFSKFHEYDITRISIKPDIGDSSLVKVIDESKLKFLSERIQELVKNKREPDLNLTISHSETKDLIIPLKKSETDYPPIKLTFFNTATRKNEEIVFYNYYKHFKKFGFEWENTTIEFKFSIEVSKDEKKFIKKMTMSKNARSRIHVDESRIWNMGKRNVKRLSYPMAYMLESEFNVVSVLNITFIQKFIYDESSQKK